MPRRRLDREGLAKELAGLPDLPTDLLRGRWKELFGLDAPARLSRDLLIRAVAHCLQEWTIGGLKPALTRRLDKAANALALGKSPSPIVPMQIKPGTRLLRDWQGETHEVIVQEQGVRYRGQIYKSLSEVACAITGAHWSGPRFFGLTGKSA